MDDRGSPLIRVTATPSLVLLTGVCPLGILIISYTFSLRNHQGRRLAYIAEVFSAPENTFCNHPQIILLQEIELPYFRIYFLILTGPTFQISRQYPRMARSEENFPIRAMLRIAIFVHCA